MGTSVELDIQSASGQANVALLRLNRPPMNAISAGVLDDLAEITQQLRQNQDIKAVVIWGGQKIFAAGADIKEFPTGRESADSASNNSANSDSANSGSADSGTTSTDSAPEPPKAISDVFTAVAELPQITISAINGYALGGGCELALCTDFRIAGEDARLGLPEILLGIIPGAGGTQRLPRLVGLSRAKEIMLTGRRVPAKEALQIGLVDEVCPSEKTCERALELAHLYAKGPAAMKFLKQVIDQGFEMPMSEALEMEKKQFAQAFKTTDAKIGIKSFLENGPGKAEFTGE